MDFFFSRLQASRDGKHLLSAGWAWHPIDYVVLYETESVLKDPATLESPLSLSLISDIWEINSAAFLTPEQLLISGHDGDDKRWSISIHDIAGNHSDFATFLDEPAGTMMPVGDHFVSFFVHPKLIETKSGRTVCRWPELPSGNQNSSIVTRTAKMPPIALDSDNLRFAVAGEDRITVIQLGI